MHCYNDQNKPTSINKHFAKFYQKETLQEFKTQLPACTK